MTTATAPAATPASAVTADRRTMLADGLAELSAWADHDLRDRLRAVQREADSWIVENDPAAATSAFEAWLDERTNRDVGRHVEALNERAARLASAAGLLVSTHVPVPAVAPAAGCVRCQPSGRGDVVLTVLRGGCGGVITAGLLGSLAGLAVAAPVSVAVGGVFAVKTFSDERSRRLAARRAEARAGLQRHLDEVVFQVGAEARRSVRALHRHFRDALAASPPAAVPAASSPADEDRTEEMAPVRATLLAPPLLTAPKGRRSPCLVGLALATVILAAGVAAVWAITPSRTAADTPAAATSPTTAVVPSLQGRAQEARRLVARLVAATRDHDVASLLATLHPAVVERYGAGACEEYLARVGGLPLDVTVRDVGPAGPWTWVIDDDAVEIPVAVPVEVSRLIGGQTIVQELHVAEATGSLRWFTDCGDPR